MTDRALLKLGRKIKSLRLKNAMTQKELAIAANIDFKHLQKIEGNASPNITLKTLINIAKALRTTAVNLLK